MIISADLHGIVDDVLERASQHPDVVRLWTDSLEMDWTSVGVAERLGGAGGGLLDLAEIAAGMGRHAISLPIWETALSAWLISSAGLSPELVARGAVAIEMVDHQRSIGDDGSQVVSFTLADVRVPDQAEVVVLVGDSGSTVHVDVVPTSEIAADPELDLSEEPRYALAVDGLRIDRASSARITRETLDEFHTRAMILRAATLVGAVERVCELTREHVQTREQFGRPLVALQSVAHCLADMVAERDLLQAAFRESLDRPEPGVAASVLVVAADASWQVAARAHQLHGAIGITHEHVLHRFTTRLWEWSHDIRSSRRVAEWLGGIVASSPSDAGLWDLTTPGLEFEMPRSTTQPSPTEQDLTGYIH